MPAQSYELSGGFRLDVGGRQLFRGQAKRPLTPSSFDVLLRLVEKSGEAVPFSELKEIAWKEVIQFEQPLRTCISEIRNALEDNNRMMVVSVPRRGYRFDGAVSISPVSNGPGRIQGSKQQNSARRIDPNVSVKPLPPYYVERLDLLARLREIVLGANGKTVAVTALEGMGGIGKTELARALCHDAKVRDAFPDGIVWIETSREPGRTLLDRMKEVAEALNEDPAPYTASNCEARYRRLFDGKAVFIVLDDVWSEGDVEPFRTDSPRCRMLLTTRNRFIAATFGAEEFSTDLLNHEQARVLLAKCSDRNLDEIPAAADEIIRECGYLPKGISEIGSTLRRKSDTRWCDILEKLRKAQLTSLYAPTKVSVDVLGDEIPEMRQRYLQLAVLLDDMSAPLPILGTLWAVDPITARDTMDEFENRSLARQEDGAIRLHALQLDYVRSEYRDQDALRLIHQAMRLSMHAVSHDATQFAPQIVARLLGFQDRDLIRAFLDSIRAGAPRPWLRPVIPALTPPSGALNGILEHLGILDLAVSADGRVAVSASEDKTLKVWDLESCKELHTLLGHNDAVVCVAVSANGQLAVSASDQTVKVWDLVTGLELHTLQGHPNAVGYVAVSADGRLAVSASYWIVKIWDLKGGQELHTVECDGFAQVLGVITSADGQPAAAVYSDRMLRILDLKSGRELRTLADPADEIEGVSADGRRAASRSGHLTLRILDVESGRTLHYLKSCRHYDWESLYESSAGLSVNAGSVVSWTLDGTLEIWDFESGRKLHVLKGHSGGIVRVAVSADGTRAVSASRDGILKVWDLKRGRESPSSRSLPAIRVGVSGDGGRAAAWSRDGKLRVLDLKRGRELHSLILHSLIDTLAVSANGTRAISGSGGTLDIWDLERVPKLRTLKTDIGSIERVAINSDGTRAVAISWKDQTLKVWDVGTGRELQTLDGCYGRPSALGVSADGRQVVVRYQEGILKAWHVASGRVLHTIKCYGDAGQGVAVSADGRLVILASLDGSLTIWNLDSGRIVHTLPGHKSKVNDVAIGADGRLVLSTYSDGTVRIWDVQSGICYCTFTCDASAESCAWGENVVVVGDALGYVHLLALEEAADISCRAPQAI